MLVFFLVASGVFCFHSFRCLNWRHFTLLSVWSSLVFIWFALIPAYSGLPMHNFLPWFSHKNLLYKTGCWLLIKVSLHNSQFTILLNSFLLFDTHYSTKHLLLKKKNNFFLERSRTQPVLLTAETEVKKHFLKI